MLKEFVAVFLLNLLTSIDNAIVLAGIANRYKNLWAMAAASSVILTICRTALIVGIVSVVAWPGFRMVLGIAVLLVAINIANVKTGEQREHSTFFRVLLTVIVTDLALSVDNIMSIAILSKHTVLIAVAVFLSLLPLFMLLPFIVRIMDQIAWLRVLAAGFVAELAIDSIMDDPLLIRRIPAGHFELFVRISSAAIVIIYGLWKTYVYGKEKTV